nr:restriction endonuclease [Deinococcus betulae]
MGVVLSFIAFIALPDLRPLTGLIFLGALIGLPFSLYAHKRRRARTLALSDLRALTHRELELHVAQVIDALPGWSARANRGTSDQGADVIATAPGGVKVAVQVKHYTNKLGNKAVQEVVASKAIYGCAHAVVFTSGPGYTKAAVELAGANKVPLWTAPDLFRLQEAARIGKGMPRDLLPHAGDWLG